MLSVCTCICTCEFGFVVFYKLGYVLLDFEAFRVDPAASILSLKGNALIGVLGGLVHTAQRYFKQKKAQLPSPKTIETKIYGGITGCGISNLPDCQDESSFNSNINTQSVN